MNSRQASYPPAPWRLRGQATVQLYLVGVDRARAWVPEGLGLLSVLPGKTLGGLVCASYNEESSLRYNELIVIAGLVRYGLRVGAWISHIYVDNARSVAGGKEVWSLPKQEAFFDSGMGQVTVRQGEKILCRVRPGAAKRRFRLPLLTPVISGAAERLSWFYGSGSARCGLGASGAIQVPSASPIAALGFSGGRAFNLDSLDLLMRAPV